ncbi:MAG: hypothetical protein ACKOD5_03730, partial [Chthoniobacterales bacterium]
MSYAAFPLDGIDTTAYIRGRRYMPDTGKGIEGTDLTPDHFPLGLFEPGVPHHITVIKRGTDIHMRIKNDQQVYYCKMSNTTLPDVTEGRVGLRHMYTRSARYKNFRISGRLTTDQSPHERREIPIRRVDCRVHEPTNSLIVQSPVSERVSHVVAELSPIQIVIKMP